MPVAIPSTLDEVVSILSDQPDATLLAGGTDAMVEINDGHRRPEGTVVALDRVTELRSWRHDPNGGAAGRGVVTIGSAVTYTELMEEPLATLLPALAEASRTVGSPQIRNAGTLGGNLGTCSPAGDGLPVLAALDATVRLVSVDGDRTVPVDEFMVGVKRTSIRPGEVIAEIDVPVRAGWQGYAKVGVRNAMVIAIASACLAVDSDARRVAIALGSVAPTVVRCTEAEVHLSGAVDWSKGTVGAEALARFAELVPTAASPITDHRSSAEYRSHAVGVLGRRLAARAFTADADPSAGSGAAA